MTDEASPAAQMKYSGAVSNAVADEISADIAYYVELAKKESPQL